MNELVQEILFALRQAEPAVAEDGSLEPLIEEAGRLAAGVIAPLDGPGDCSGAHLLDGAVTMPEGFAGAYAQWRRGGWNGINAPEAWGGAALPLSVGAALMELWNAASLAFALCPLLTQSAIEVLARYAAPDLQALYLPRLVSGEWTAAMNLTEPQSGSDLSLLRTRAVPAENGSFRLYGQKVFITYGEHDLAANIVHLVLARFADAPLGTRGLSLFLVPKFLPGPSGALGRRNDVVCAGIEHKLGLRASPTCTMIFGAREGAEAFLVGAPQQGMAAMFAMMNRARLFTGIQGIALAGRAFRLAHDYARERRQGHDANGTPLSIAAHPDVRRMLWTMRSQTLASRALALRAAAAFDTAAGGAEAEAMAARAALLIPIVKAFGAETGVEAASLGIQVFGGLGYIEATGAAQLLRDARIVPIYEGTNGIQAIDLVQRKLRRDRGEAARAEIDAYRAMAPSVAEPLDVLAAATEWLAGSACANEQALAVASPYLRLFALAAGAALLARDAMAAGAPAGTAEAAAFFTAHLASAAPGLAHTVIAGAGSVVPI